MQTTLSRNTSSATSLTAEQLAQALGLRRIGRNRYRGRRNSGGCPKCGHKAFEIKEPASGKPLFWCWGGRCSQDEIRGALRERGLWHDAGEHHRRPAPRFTFVEPKPLATEFELEMQIAHLRGNLDDAVAELREKYQCAERVLDARALRGEIEFAVEFGAIAPAGLDARVVAEVLDAALGKDRAPEGFPPLVVKSVEEVGQ